MAISEEDRILRVWTPVILRSVLTVSALVLIIGILVMMVNEPSYYNSRFHQVQSRTASVHQSETFAQLAKNASQGDPHGIMTIGLIILTLVPLARVVFTFLLFLKERDIVFVVATAYVLTGLIAGVVLGRIG